MDFTSYGAAEYRAMDADALDAQRQCVIDLLNADELPENVTADALYEEQRSIMAEYNRRNAEIELRNANLTAVTSGAGNVIAHSDPTPAPAQKRGTIQPMNEPEHFTDSMEYRRALVDHILHRRAMPYDMQMRANADIADSINGDFASVSDFTNTMSNTVAFPHSVMGGIIQQLDEYGNLFAKVQKLSLPGAIWYREDEIAYNAGWINDTQTTAYNEDKDPTAFSFTWHQLEVRHSRTMLANALMTDDLKALVPPALVKAMVKAIEQAIIKGNGTTQPLGITTDERLVGTNGKAAIIEVTAEQVDSWEFWRTLLYDTASFNRLYRERGEWVFGDSTWGLHVDCLRDDNNVPLGKADPLNDTAPLTLRNRPVNLVEDALLPSFDSAQNGDVIGIFGDLNNYVINTQPGMPLATVQWSDYETNTEKTRVLTALDGRPTNPYGWAILKKKVGA